MRNSVDGRQLTWKTINEVSRRKSNSKANLKTASQEERLQKWKVHFKNLLGKSSKITDKPTEKIINSQQDIKLGQFIEVDAIRKKFKAEKLQILAKYFLKYGRQENLTPYIFDHPTLCLTKHNRGIEKKLHPSFLQERWPLNPYKLQKHNSHCYCYWGA